MRQMKKRWMMLLPTVLLLALAFSTTVFAAEEEAVLRPCPRRCGDRPCADHKGSVQFIVCGYFDGRPSVLGLSV